LLRHVRPNTVCRCSLLASRGSGAVDRIVQRHTAYQYVPEERLRQQQRAADCTNSIAQRASSHCSARCAFCRGLDKQVKTKSEYADAGGRIVNFRDAVRGLYWGWSHGNRCRDAFKSASPDQHLLSKGHCGTCVQCLFFGNLIASPAIKIACFIYRYFPIHFVV